MICPPHFVETIKHKHAHIITHNSLGFICLGEDVLLFIFPRLRITMEEVVIPLM